MAIKPHNCPKHGATTAYVYRVKRGPSRGLVRRTCRECRSAEVRRDWQRIKSETIAAYGGRCKCCGEREPRFLTIDHTNGDGREHRNAGIRGWRLYQWLKARGYPKSGYRLLCFNCNCARGQFGRCPHQDR